MAAGAFVKTDVAPEFRVQDANPDQLSATLDDAAFTSGTVVTGEGMHTLRVTAMRDQSCHGNESALSETTLATLEWWLEQDAERRAKPRGWPDEAAVSAAIEQLKG